MIQFSHRDEKITKLFAIIFWILVGFHIIFGCITDLTIFAITFLRGYHIFDIFHIVDRRYVMAFIQWNVS